MTLFDSSTKAPVLVVAAHPDDEVLGIGGTVARHVADGSDVHVLILAEGETSRTKTRDSDAATDDLHALRQAAAQAASILGTQPPRFAGLPDNRLDEMALLDVVKIVEGMVADVRPAIVYTHWHGDLNVDHRIAFEAVATACRPLPGASVRTVAAFETVSSSEWSAEGTSFAPNCFVDIGRHLERKLEALAAYDREMRPYPHARSLNAVRALAQVRGASAGMTAAEALLIHRHVVGEA